MKIPQRHYYVAFITLKKVFYEKINMKRSPQTSKMENIVTIVNG